MPDTLNLHAAQALRALADVLDQHSDLPEPVYISISLWHDAAPAHADMQFSLERTPEQNIAAVDAWTAALGTTPGDRLSRAARGTVAVKAYHPDYTAEEAA